MSDEVKPLADEPRPASSGNSYTAIVMPALLAAFSFWATTHSSGAVVWLLFGAGTVLVLSVAWILVRGHKITNPQDYYGGLALIGLALFAFWASSDLSGMRGFSFGPGTAPRLFSGILLCMGVAVTLVGVFMEGAHLESYAIRGPLMVTLAILLFAALIRPVGLIISSFLVFMVASAGAKDVRWFEAVLAAVALTAFCTFLFPYALGLQFQLWPRFY
jgi:putative tricarboxylic transport membrane protein